MLSHLSALYFNCFVACTFTLCTPSVTASTSPCVPNNPCFNGGICFENFDPDSPTTFVCSCIDGYSGFLCETLEGEIQDPCMEILGSLDGRYF